MALWQIGAHWKTSIGGVTILDPEQDPIAFFPNPIDVVQFYIPRTALDEFAYENRTAIVNTLSWPHCEMDTTLKQLGMTILSAIQRCKPAPKIFLDYIGQASHRKESRFERKKKSKSAHLEKITKRL